MRVIAGRWGGRRLTAPKGTAITRPTSERVREAVFSMLGRGRGGGGAGPLRRHGRAGDRGALERREAGRVRRAGRARAGERWQANLEALGLQEGEAEVRRGEALGALRRARACAETYDLVLIDPPYRRASDLGREISMALAPLLAPKARVVVESDRRAPLELPWEIVKERRYGDTSITIHRHA